MRSKIVITSALLACVSSGPLDAGYGVPGAPLVVSQPLLKSAVAAPLPLQLLNSVPFQQLQSAPVPLGAAPFGLPLTNALPINAAAAPLSFAGSPASLPFAAAPFPTAGTALPFANAPLPVAHASLPLSAAPLPLSAAPFPLAGAPLPLGPAPLPLGPAPLPLSAGPLPFSAAPVSLAPAPLAQVLPTSPSSQFHAQDEFGQFSFGYENINSKKTETKDAFGVTRGSYEYVDANNVLQVVKYVSDPINGFRVAGTNIPVAPAAPNAALPVAPLAPVPAPLVAPKPVMETPEVAAARAEHLAAHDKLEKAIEVSERKKRSTDYQVPAAPVLVPVATPAPITVNSLPAPFINHPFAHPAPVAPLPLSAGPFALPVGPSSLPFAQAPLSLSAAINPFPVANAAAPFPVGAAPINFATAPAAPFVGAPLPLGPAPLPLSAAPLPFAGGPLPVAPTPFAQPLPSAPSSQFHAQDEFGQFSFGYENINSKKTETKDAFGVTRGSYEYVDANNVLQVVKYVSDPVNGFRVAGTNIPVAPAAPNAILPVAPLVPVPAPLKAPLPVKETPEVAAARAKHLAAVAAAKKNISKKEDETTKAEEL